MHPSHTILSPQRVAIVVCACTVVLVAGCSGRPVPEQKQRTVALETRQLHSRAASDGIATSELSVPFSAEEHRAVEHRVAVPENRERYAVLDDSATHLTRESPVSTFSVDVDTGAYANVRRFLNAGALPVRDAVRTEELLNYFDYELPGAESLETPFSLTTEVGPTPWNDRTHLLHIGLKGFEPAGDRPPANLVFLIDVSGSMQGPGKLDLLIPSFRLLARQLTAEDRVAIVTYAGQSGVVLPPTPGNDIRRIEAALSALSAGGSTAGQAGIEEAYRLAEQEAIEGGVNRVVLATDGDFNVGLSSTQALIGYIERKRRGGIALTTLGFGQGNLNDHLLEQLADHGNGQYAYIDTLKEANKILVKELTSTLLTIASDVKVQLEFNPAVVSEYRLIGYANRALANEDFQDDRVDAGDVGAGHAVVALYEIALVGQGGDRHMPKRYGVQNESKASPAYTDELAEIRLRYKRPGETRSALLRQIVRRDQIRPTAEQTHDNFRFAAAVAAFGQSLRHDTRIGAFSYNDIRSLALGARGVDPDGYRAEFISLVDLAASLDDAPAGPMGQNQIKGDFRG